MAKRFKTLGLEFTEERASRNVASALRRFNGLEGYPTPCDPVAARYFDVTASLDLCVLTHLEVGATGFDLQYYIKQGVRVAVDYFYGDYLRTDEKAARMMCKAPDNESLSWCEVHREGLLLAILAEDPEAERRLVEWVEPWLPFDGGGYAVKPEDNAFHKLLAEHLREGRFVTPALREAILAKRSKRPKLLLACLEAVQAGDGVAFAKGFREYLAYFLKSDFDQRGFESLFSVDGSILVEVARRAGIEPTGLSEKESALLMTRQTLGLA
ncbi:MAG: hypothetical protein ACRCT8_09850 [Lacipirellulaceae bacterium]